MHLMDGSRYFFAGFQDLLNVLDAMPQCVVEEDGDLAGAGDVGGLAAAGAA